MTKPVGFWGLVVEPGKIYSQKVPEAFRITMATLGPAAAKESAAERRSVLMLTHHKDGEFALCSLTQGAHEQQQLDLVFNEGEMIHIRVEGALGVHLTGNYVEMDAPDALDYDEEDMGSDACTDDSVSCGDDSECCSDECSGDECCNESCSDDISCSDDYSCSDEDYCSGSDASADSEVESEDESIDSDEAEPRIVEIKEESKPKKAKVSCSGMVACAADGCKTACGSSTPVSMSSPSQKSAPTKDAPAAAKSASSLSQGAALAPKTSTPSKSMSYVDIKQGTAGAIKAQKARTVDVTITPVADSEGTVPVGKAQDLSFNLNDREVLGSLRDAVRGMAIGGERRVTLRAAALKGATPGAKGPNFGEMCAADGSAHFVVRLDKVHSAK